MTHDIGTIILRYKIAGLEIQLKSIWTSLRLPPKPSIAARVLRCVSLSFVLIYVMTDAYGSLRFSASLLLTLVHYGANALLVVKTKKLASVNSCLFSAYLSNAFNWQGWEPRRCSFFHFRLICCCDSGVSSSYNLFWQLRHSSFFCLL